MQLIFVKSSLTYYIQQERLGSESMLFNHSLFGTQNLPAIKIETFSNITKFIIHKHKTQENSPESFINILSSTQKCAFICKEHSPSHAVK